MTLEDLRGGRVRHNVKNAEILHHALKDAGINFVAMVPDSYFREVNRLLQEDRDIKSVTATREDEGMAICAGAYMGMSGVENKFRFIRHIEATEGKRILSIPIRTSQKLSS